MRTLTPLDFNYKDILEKYLVDSFADGFDDHRAILLDAVDKYNENCRPNSLHKVDHSQGQYRTLVKYYENEFVSGSLRRYYDLIRALTSNCPHCGSVLAGCLDHYLPKERYNHFSIYPLNLVPICKICNEAKGGYWSSDYHASLLNPYFDNYNSEVWLGARVIVRDPILVEFYVRNGGYDEVDIRRISNYLTKMKLDIMFQANASNEIIGVHLELHNLFKDAGADEVRAALRDRSSSWGKKFPNSWQSALYQGLSEDEWFCNEFVSKY